MRKFTKGDEAIWRGERVIIGRNRKTNEARQTWYYAKPIEKKTSLRPSFVRSDYLQAV